MKFKVYYDVKPNMFGKLEGHMTLIGDDDSTPYNISWFLDKIIHLFNMESADIDTINDQKNVILNRLINLEIDDVIPFANKENEIVAAVQRVCDNKTLGDLLEEEYEFI